MRTSVAVPRLAMMIFLPLLLSCGGDAQGPGSDDGTYIRFRANGELIEYRNRLETPLYALFTPVAMQHMFAVVGSGSTQAGERTSANIGVSDVAPITTATYTGFQVRPGGGHRSATILFNRNENTDPTQWSSGISNVQVTLAEITDTHVRGTFSGSLAATGRPPVAITAGEFYARRQP